MFEDPQSSDEEFPVPDADACSGKELVKLFQQEISPSSEIAASLKRTCGLHIAQSCEYDTLAVGLSRKELQLYRVRESGELALENGSLGRYESAIRGVRFFNGDPNSLFCCTEDGDIHLYDIRTGSEVHHFEETSEGAKKTISSCDINQSDRVLCASSEVQKNGDSFLLFFDVRERNYLGCYWECHSDDITHVRFHPTNPDLFASASVDGLINVFDISKLTEDDAMQYCFNIETAIDAINWHSDPTGRDLVSCVTTTNDLHLYDVESQDSVALFNREQITHSMRRTSSIDCNVVGTHNYGNGSFFVLAGSNFNKGKECLRTLRYDNKCLLPDRSFNGNKQIVRASVYNDKDQYLIATGECGLITLWKCRMDGTEQTSTINSASKNLKQKLHGNVSAMGSKVSIITNEQLAEYAELTYLSKAEIIFILQKFLLLDGGRQFSLTKRFPEQDVVNLFPQLKHNPFRDRLLHVFSSENDDRFSFEDLLDLFSVLSEKCPLAVKATWAFQIYDFDNDKLITKEDILELCDRITKHDRLEQTEKMTIADLLLKEMDLQNNGNIGEFEFIHALSKMPEFRQTFSCRV
uniref:WD repeat-containing protein 89 n=1 Tax=Anopheles culicifacies TaxID=139723 RepID=A0A182M0G5_9DIPT